MNESPSPLTAETLLSHAPWLRALARSLVGDSHRAEDVVQQTWLQALSHPPENLTGLRAWLAKTARRIAWRGTHREQRREEWERNAAREEALPSTEDALDQLQLQRLVVDSVLSLDEPYRDVVLLRYFHGIAPTDIGKQMGIPASTVRSQLTRSLARLRSQLDAQWDGRSTWRLTIVPLLAGSREPTTTQLAQGVLSTWQAKAAGALLLVGMLSWAWNARPSTNDNAAGLNPLNNSALAPSGQGTLVPTREREDDTQAAAPPTEPTRPEAAAMLSPRALEHPIEVRVHDHIGAAAPGVSVGLEAFRELMWERVATAVSDPQGHVSFGQVLRHLSRMNASRPLRLIADIHATDPPTVRFDHRDLGKRRYELELPALGAVRIHVVDSTGKTRNAHSVASLLLQRRNEVAVGRRQGLLFQQDRATRIGLPHSTGSGSAVFPHVGLRLDLMARLHAANAATTYFAGPQTPGHVVDVTLICNDPIFSARIVDAARAPLANETVTFIVHESNPVEDHYIPYALKTGSDGSIRTFLPVSSSAQTRTRLFVERGQTQLEPLRLSGRDATWVELDTSNAPQSERNLGTLVLQKPSRLASGFVLDSRGFPFRGARVRLYQKAPGTESWHQFTGYEVLTDREGRFELTGIASHPLLRAAATTPADTPPVTSLPFAPGSEGIMLEVRDGLKLQGHALFDDFVRPEMIRAWLQQDEQLVASDILRANGTFAMGPVAPGTYRLTFYLGPIRIPGVEELFIDAATHTNPLTVDLRGRVRQLRLLLIDERSNPIRRTPIYLRHRHTGKAISSGGTDANGRLRLITPPTGSDFAIASIESRLVDVDWSPEEQTIVMARGAQLRIRCPIDRFPGPPYRVLVRSQMLSSNDERIELLAPGASRERELTERGELTLPITHLGSYRLDLLLARDRPFGQPQIVPVGEPLHLHIHEYTTLQQDLVPAIADIERAMAAFY